MNRRGFIKDCGAACAGAVGISAFLQSCMSANYFAGTTVSNSMITVKKSEFISVHKGKSRERKYVLVKTDRSEFPIFLYKRSEKEYSALLMCCTHKGCELQPHGEFLVCPCHGSEFTNTGVVLNPPAEQNLRQYKTTADNDNIYIQL